MTPNEFIKSKQNNVLLNDYTLQDMIWFMTEFAKQEVSEQLLIQRVVLRSEQLCEGCNEPKKETITFCRECYLKEFEP